jgi:hypothetical protein
VLRLLDKTNGFLCNACSDWLNSTDQFPYTFTHSLTVRERQSHKSLLLASYCNRSERDGTKHNTMSYFASHFLPPSSDNQNFQNNFLTHPHLDGVGVTQTANHEGGAVGHFTTSVSPTCGGQNEPCITRYSDLGTTEAQRYPPTKLEVGWNGYTNGSMTDTVNSHGGFQGIPPCGPTGYSTVGSTAQTTARCSNSQSSTFYPWMGIVGK